MELLSNSNNVGVKRKLETIECEHMSCKRRNLEGCLFKISGQPFEGGDIEPLPLEEIFVNLNSADLSANIGALDHIRQLCECKKSFDDSFLSDTCFLHELVQACIGRNKAPLYIASIKMIGEIVKRETEKENFNTIIPYLVLCLDSSVEDLCIEAIRALANVKFVTNLSATMFIAGKGHMSLLHFVDFNIELDVLKAITRTLFKVFQTRPPLTAGDLDYIFFFVQRLLLHSNSDVLENTFGMLDHLTKSLNGPFNQILHTTRIMPSIVEQLYNWNLRVSVKALNVISNFIFYGSTYHAKFVLQFDILPAIPGLLKSAMLRIKALEVVNEYARGGEEDIQKVLDADITKTVLELITDDQVEVSRQSIMLFKTIAESGKWSQIKSVLNMGLISILYSILCAPSSDSVLKMAMVTMRSYLNVATVDLEILKEILKETEAIPEKIEILKELPNIIDIRYEALNLGYSLLSAKLWLEKYLGAC